MPRQKPAHRPRSAAKRREIVPGHSNAVGKSGNGGIGGRIRYEGQPGTITGTSGPYLIVRPDDMRWLRSKLYRWILHPTWHVEYSPVESEGE